MYGRARRIALVKKIAIVAVLIFIVYILFTKVFIKENFVDQNQNFAYMKSYFNGKGYICERIEHNAGRCYKETETTYIGFIRYDDGFNYVDQSTSYRLTINYLPTEVNQIVLKTNSTSLEGYKNKIYYCTTKDNVLGEIDKCVTEDGEKLDVQSYIGVVEKAQSDVDKIINASGYDKEVLLEEYKWQK